MKLYQIASTFCLIAAATATGPPISLSPIISRNATTPSTNSTALDFTKIKPSTYLKWTSCGGGTFQCAVLIVPLDYSNPYLSHALVPILKYPAPSGVSQGMIFTNPGGPGESGIDFLVAEARMATRIVGDNYDLVAWEPRGVGYSVPLANCSVPASNLGSAKSRLVRRALDSGDYEFPASLFEAVYDEAGALGESCKSEIGGHKDAGRHMTTSVVVKDLATILDAYVASPAGRNVTDPSLLNYWGFSYGTIIGQTFASVFPDRVGRVVLDGVVNPYDYTSGNLQTWLQTTDEAFATFFVYCNLAGPSLCPYYTGTSSLDIFDRFTATIATLNTVNSVVQSWDNATLIADVLEGLKLITFQTEYTPITAYPQLATWLVLFENAVQNLTVASVQLLVDIVSGSNSTLDLNSTVSPFADILVAGRNFLGAIACSDNNNTWYKKPLSEIIPSIQQLENQSFIGGEALAINILICSGWEIRSDDIYLGPFGGPTIQTKNPVLFVSNTRDPVTPLSSGQGSTALFQNSRLLTIDGTGHTSLAATNQCAFAAIGTYLQAGILPANGTSCPLEAGVWNITVPGGFEANKDFQTIKASLAALR